MANSEMALLTEKRLKEMEAEMNRFEQEILVPKEYEVGGHRMIIGAGTFNKVKAQIRGGPDEPPHKMVRHEGPGPGPHPGPKPPQPESSQYSDPNIPLSVLAAPPPPPPSLISSSGPSSSSSGVPNLAPPPPPPPAMRPNLPFVPHQIRQRMPPPPPPHAGPPGQGPPRPPPPFMGGQGGPGPYSGGFQGPPHPQPMPNRGPPMRPPYGGPGPQGPMPIGPNPPFHGGPPVEQKKDPVIEKPKVVYSSAPVINKPEKKKKKKKDNSEEGGSQGETGNQNKTGPPGGNVPTVTPVPQPEVVTHVPEPEPVVEVVPKKEKKEKKPKKIIRTAAGETWEDQSLEEWEKDDFRIFCGDLGNEVTDEVLARAFSRYPSFLKSKVVRDKRTNKTKGYGFVSFKDPNDFVQAMREMNGKYVGNRPIKLRKSSWKDRNIEIVRKKEKEKKRLGLR
ncbi:RNA-binding protein 42-like [Saccostrea echinata]|uniref:RNA-binding protein 42-like n=1 Tax=Saccostrea echinata TaxID=191078 RepID=UPI002A7EB8FE|nr:RNA-binding protein 42-like [Saccostrea echinata]